MINQSTNQPSRNLSQVLEQIEGRSTRFLCLSNSPDIFPFNPINPPTLSIHPVCSPPSPFQFNPLFTKSVSTTSRRLDRDYIRPKIPHMVKGTDLYIYTSFVCEREKGEIPPTEEFLHVQHTACVEHYFQSRNSPTIHINAEPVDVSYKMSIGCMDDHFLSFPSLCPAAGYLQEVRALPPCALSIAGARSRTHMVPIWQNGTSLVTDGVARNQGPL